MNGCTVLRVLGGLGLFVFALPSVVHGFEPLVGEFHHDFRAGPAPDALTLYNVANERFFRQEPEGLRITIPSTWSHPQGGIGYRSAFGLTGDFEVTATMALLKADAPPNGFAVGVGIRLQKANSNDETMLARVVRPNGSHVILRHQLMQVPGRMERQNESDQVPCADTVFRLRLKRTGTIITYSWAPGAAGGEFQELNRGEFGRDDLQHVRLVAMTNQRPCELDGRFVEVSMRSGAVAEAEPLIWYLLASMIILCRFGLVQFTR